MKVKAALARYGREKAVASLQQEDDMDIIDLVVDNSAKSACLKAARKLEKLASDFRQLAEEENPFLVNAQDRISKSRRGDQ